MIINSELNDEVELLIQNSPENRGQLKIIRKEILELIKKTDFFEN